MLVIFKFIICAFIIFFAGSRLSKYGDAIADKTGLGHAWIGIVLLAAITSLPELFNGISAVAFVGAPDLAVGNIVGACLVNMAVVGALDIYQFSRGKKTIFLELGRANHLSIYFGVILALIFGSGTFLAKRIVDFSVLGIGIYSIIIFLAYLIAQRAIYVSERDRYFEKEEAPENSLLYIKFAFFAAIVIAAGIWLPYIGDEMAATFNLGKSFIGVFFLGVATTLPELVVSITALKYSVDMSIGNLLGSNIFNLSLLFIDDIFYQPASLFQAVSFSQFIIGLFLLFSFSLMIVALRTKTRSRLYSLGLIVSYLLGIYVVLTLR